MTEIKTFDSFHEPRQAFSAAPLGVGLLHLAMQRQISLNLAAGACAAAAEEKMGQMTLDKLVGISKFPEITKVEKLIPEFGVGWVEGFLYEVVRLSQSEMKEMNMLVARLTAAQIFALIGAFGMQAFVYGPTVLFQECWKKQSLQQTLFILVITLGRVKELLDLCDFCDAVLLKRAMPRARGASRYVKAQVIELHLILQTSDTQMMMNGHGLSSLGSRAYLMNALPHALAKALCVYVTLNHGYYAAAYYPEVPLEWIQRSGQMICLITMMTGKAFCQGASNDLSKRTMNCMPMQFYGYLKTAKQLKSNMSRRYNTRTMKNPFQKFFVESKPKSVFLAIVDDLGDFATFPMQQEEYDQIRMTLADALHPTVNTDLSETIMPAAMPKKLIQYQPMFNIFNSIEVPKFVQRSHGWSHCARRT